MKRKEKNNIINGKKVQWENRGITIIALVVTIIILLILAGVTIALLTGDNGILTNANTAKAETMKKQAKEKINIALNAIKLEVLNQRNKNSGYNPNENASSLMNDSVTGITGTTVGTAGAETGYYANHADSKITIAYVDAKGHYTVTGNIDFTDYSNGGTITKATVGGETGGSGSETGSGTGTGAGSGSGGNTGGTGATVYVARGTPEVPAGSQTLADNYIDTMAGAYVKYSAGVWGSNSDAIMKQLGKNNSKYENYSGTDAPSQQGQFGGWQPDTWVATGISSSTESGQYQAADGTPAWRILGKDSNGCIQLMATYITEEYYHDTQRDASYVLMNGSGARSFSVYENTLLAVAGSAHAMTYEEAISLQSKNPLRALKVQGLNGLNYDIYWVPGGSPSNSYIRYVNSSSLSLNETRQTKCGIRPVVTLKSDVLYSGTGTAQDPYVVGYSE